MSFDIDPKEQVESHECVVEGCGGNVECDDDGVWSCDKCSWTSECDYGEES
jgi:ribosomal protein L37AE/L43A